MATSNGIGPNGTSLLDKLGLKGIKDMSNDELRKLVSGDRLNRTLVRTAGRIKRIAKSEKEANYKPKPQPTLESIGLAPALITKLRSGGKSDAEIISTMKARGLI